MDIWRALTALSVDKECPLVKVGVEEDMGMRELKEVTGGWCKWEREVIVGEGVASGFNESRFGVPLSIFIIKLSLLDSSMLVGEGDLS